LLAVRFLLRTVLTFGSVANELEEDAKEAIGAEDVVWKVVHGGHEFPISHPDEVVGHIAEVWNI
jgi:hypothetical protein